MLIAKGSIPLLFGREPVHYGLFFFDTQFQTELLGLALSKIDYGSIGGVIGDQAIRFWLWQVSHDCRVVLPSGLMDTEQNDLVIRRRDGDELHS